MNRQTIQEMDKILKDLKEQVNTLEYDNEVMEEYLDLIGERENYKEWRLREYEV